VALSAEGRSVHARVAAHAKWAQSDPVAGTAKARAAFESRFLDEVDPDRALPKAERTRRAAHARKAYFARLTLASVKARRRKAGKR
jgi:hypothetical protein